MIDVAVVGGGIAGLACASELVERGRDVRLFEAAPEPGGSVESAERDGLILERGASTVRGTPALRLLAERARVPLVEGRRLAPAVVADGTLVSLPPGPAALLRGRPFPLGALSGALLEPLRRSGPGPRTVERFFAERFGPRLAHAAADLMTLGVYGAPAASVGFESAFPSLAERLARHGSLARAWLADRSERAPREPLVSTASGLGALCHALARGLGERVQCGAPAISLSRDGAAWTLAAGGERVRARDVVLAVGPDRAATLVDDGPIARVLRGYRAVPQTLASFALVDAACAQRIASFGFLVPRQERLPLLGCLFPSAIFPGRAPDDTLLLTVFVGPELVDAPDAALDRALGPLLARLVGSAARPALVDVRRHRPGIWLYDRRHRDRTRVLRARLARAGGPCLVGWAFDGIAFGAAAASGLAAARRIAER